MIWAYYILSIKRVWKNMSDCKSYCGFILNRILPYYIVKQYVTKKDV